MHRVARSVSVVLACALVTVVTSASTPTSATEAPGPYYYNAGNRVPIVRSATRVAIQGAAAAKRSDLVASIEAITSVRRVRDIRAGGVVEVTVDDAASVPSELASVSRSSGAALLPVFFEPGVERDESTLFISSDVLVQF